jgi:hypothetical protein
MTCDVCHRTLRIGAWPFCPHEASHVSLIRDEIPGGQWFENGFDTPQKFYSHSEHRAALAAHGYEIRAKWAGPADTHLTNWAHGTVDLDKAAALVTRTRPVRYPTATTDPEAAIDVTITKTSLETSFRVERA